MKQISNSTVEDLVRLLPIILEQGEFKRDLKIINAARRLGIIVKKLQRLKDNK